MGRNKKKKSEKKQNIQQSDEALTIAKTNNSVDSQDEETNRSKESSNESYENKELKRPHDSEDSDGEDKPKKPKKKKKIQVADDPSTAGKKNKVSKRQQKREKYAAKLALEQANAKDQTKLQSLNYLSQWKHDRQNWKFMKARQVWLHKNKFSTEMIPDASWPIFLEYFESAMGNIKTTLLNDANKIIKQMDEWTESQTTKESETEQAESTEVVKPDDTVYNRARSIIQSLQE